MRSAQTENILFIINITNFMFLCLLKTYLDSWDVAKFLLENFGNNRDETWKVRKIAGRNMSVILCN